MGFAGRFSGFPGSRSSRGFASIRFGGWSRRLTAGFDTRGFGFSGDP